MKLSKRDNFKLASEQPIDVLKPFPPFWTKATSHQLELNLGNEMISIISIDVSGGNIYVAKPKELSFPKEFEIIAPSVARMNIKNIDRIKSLMQDLSNYVLVIRDQFLEQGNSIHEIIPPNLIEFFQPYAEITNNSFNLQIGITLPDSDGEQLAFINPYFDAAAVLKIDLEKPQMKAGVVFETRKPFNELIAAL